MKIKSTVGIIFCLLFTLPVFSAAYPARNISIKIKPYWSKPKSFWTPANAQKQLEENADQAVCVRIYGRGRLWQRLTRLPTDNEIVRRSHRNPEAVGILIQNKQLIRLMPGLLRNSDKVLEGKNLAQADKIEIQIYARKPNASDEAMFLWWDSKPYCFRPMIGALEMKPGSGTRFNDFIRQVARDAREHRHRVSFYHYNAYQLSPT